MTIRHLSHPIYRLSSNKNIFALKHIADDLTTPCEHIRQFASSPNFIGRCMFHRFSPFSRAAAGAVHANTIFVFVLQINGARFC